MAALERLTLDREGVAELLRSPEFNEAVRSAAEQVAQSARSGGHRVASGDALPIDLFDDPNHDRVGWTVAIRHPAGVGMEARYGVLRKAAEATGLAALGGIELDEGS